MTRRLTDILFPTRCPVCDRILGGDEACICADCERRVPLITGPTCMKCGRPVEDAVQEYCFECTKKNHRYSAGYAALVYNEDMRRAMSGLKFNNRRDNADFFVHELLKGCRSFVEAFAPDMLVPVPIHRSRRRTRGYNQAELLALGLSGHLGIPVIDALVREKKTLPQKKLSDTERLLNLKGAFAPNPDEGKRIIAGRILLVDDIYTTGSTLEACTETLLEGGAGEVGIICACIGKGS